MAQYRAGSGRRTDYVLPTWNSPDLTPLHAEHVNNLRRTVNSVGAVSTEGHRVFGI